MPGSCVPGRSNKELGRELCQGENQYPHSCSSAIHNVMAGVGGIFVSCVFAHAMFLPLAGFPGLF